MTRGNNKKGKCLVRAKRKRISLFAFFSFPSFLTAPPPPSPLSPSLSPPPSHLSYFSAHLTHFMPCYLYFLNPYPPLPLLRLFRNILQPDPTLLCSLALFLYSAIFSPFLQLLLLLLLLLMYHLLPSPPQAFK